MKGTLHWISTAHAKPCEVRLFDRLFTIEDLSDIPRDEDWRDYLNPDSLEILEGAMIEPWFAESWRDFDKVQFMRHGYFAADTDSTEERPIFNRSVSLRDTWAKIAKK